VTSAGVSPTNEATADAEVVLFAVTNAQVDKVFVSKPKKNYELRKKAKYAYHRYRFGMFDIYSSK
jgi:hypothetical protein